MLQDRDIRYKRYERYEIKSSKTSQKHHNLMAWRNHPTLSKVRRHDLDNSRSSNSVVVVDNSIIGSQDGKRLASRTINANGDSGVNLAVLDHSRRKHGAGSKREGNKQRASGNLHVGCKVKLDGLALHNGHLDVLANAERGEGLDGECGVGGRASLDEGGCERVDLVKVEGNVEGLGERRGVEVAADKGVVAGFDGQDGACGGEVGLVCDEGGGAEVCAHTDTLDDGCGGQEGGGCEVAKVVCASSDGCNTGSLQGGGQEVDVCLFVAANLLEVLVEVGLVEASSGKVSSRELGEGFAVEVGLEMLKSQRIVEDDSVEALVVVQQ